jgi:hypothetical protein
LESLSLKIAECEDTCKLILCHFFAFPFLDCMILHCFHGLLFHYFGEGFNLFFIPAHGRLIVCAVLQ